MRPGHHIFLYHIRRMVCGKEYKSWSYLTMKANPVPCNLVPLRPNYLEGHMNSSGKLANYFNLNSNSANTKRCDLERQTKRGLNPSGIYLWNLEAQFLNCDLCRIDVFPQWPWRHEVTKSLKCSVFVQLSISCVCFVREFWRSTQILIYCISTAIRWRFSRG